MVKLEQAILNPKGFFKTPQEVVNNQTFSIEEKIIILRLWAYDAERLEVAEEENMSGKDEDMLKNIIDCLSALERQKSV